MKHPATPTQPQSYDQFVCTEPESQVLGLKHTALPKETPNHNALPESASLSEGPKPSSQPITEEQRAQLKADERDQRPASFW